MKIKKLIAMTIFSFICSAQAEEIDSHRIPVPFYHLPIPSGKKITATYSYKPKHQTLVCSVDTSSLGAIFWKYNTVPQALTFPVNGNIFLKSHPTPEGLFADPQGRIVIKSSRTNTSDLIVSCEYHSWS